MIITISGNLGSGKSTVADLLAKKLDFKRHSTGEYMRRMAEKRGITLLELSKHAELDASIDKELDNWQIDLSKKEDDFIIDARLAFHFIPKSYKIFLKVNDDEAARRIFNHDHPNRKKEVENTTISATMKNIERRRSSERQRYLELYNLDYENESYYDIVIDTTKIPAKKVLNLILKDMKAKKLIQKSSKS